LILRPTGDNNLPFMMPVIVYRFPTPELKEYQALKNDCNLMACK